jgi:hypothetical protein
LPGVRSDRVAGEMQNDLSQRHLPRPRCDELLGILILSAAQLMILIARL